VLEYTPDNKINLTQFADWELEEAAGYEIDEDEEDADLAVAVSRNNSANLGQRQTGGCRTAVPMGTMTFLRVMEQLWGCNHQQEVPMCRDGVWQLPRCHSQWCHPDWRAAVPTPSCLPCQHKL
jgi:hypothetical protein